MGTSGIILRPVPRDCYGFTNDSFLPRYFFKTECEDLDTKVIQEEITDDSEVLPLWEGKVMAQVKALE